MLVRILFLAGVLGLGCSFKLETKSKPIQDNVFRLQSMKHFPGLVQKTPIFLEKQEEYLKNGTHVIPKDYLKNGTHVIRKGQRINTFGEPVIYLPEVIALGTSVTIKTPNYPNNYYGDSAIGWSFTGDGGELTLRFEAIDIETSNGGCDYDILIVSGEGVRKSLCGATLPRPIVLGGRAAVLFISDSTVEKRGFKATITSGKPTSNQCKCGRAKRVVRIVGGQETQVNEYPWQVGIAYRSTSDVFCGAAVISQKHILTAAHCAVTSLMQNSLYDLLLAAHNLTQGSSEQVRISGIGLALSIHSGYDSDTMDNDIALITLNSPLNFSTIQARPVCLPQNPNASYDNADVVATGWGALSSGGSFPDALQEVTLTVLSNDECKENTNYDPSEITANMLCAGVDGGGKDTCQGDSGGPLVYDSNGSYETVGITSWGYGRASNGYPGVYTRVTRYITWLQSNGFSSQMTCPRYKPKWRHNLGFLSLRTADLFGLDGFSYIIQECCWSRPYFHLNYLMLH